jgi:hypothetical protein
MGPSCPRKDVADHLAVTVYCTWFANESKRGYWVDFESYFESRSCCYSVLLLSQIYSGCSRIGGTDRYRLKFVFSPRRSTSVDHHAVWKWRSRVLVQMAAYGSIELPYHGPLHTDNDPATQVVLPLHTGSVWDRRGKQIMISTFFASGLLVMATLSSPTKPVLSSHSDLDYVGVHCTVLPFSKSWETSALNCQVCMS